MRASSLRHLSHQSQSALATLRPSPLSPVISPSPSPVPSPVPSLPPPRHVTIPHALPPSPIPSVLPTSQLALASFSPSSKQAMSSAFALTSASVSIQGSYSASGSVSRKQVGGRVRCYSSSSSSVQEVAVSSSSSEEKPKWQARMLYDGECPLCMREVNFLRGKDAGRGIVDFVDIAAPDYNPADNAGINFEEGMKGLHCITADGEVLMNVPAFRRLYELLGMGWVYAITTVEPFGTALDRVYDVWAKYRMQVTGRDALEVILERRRTGGATCATLEGACELPTPKKENSQ